MRRVLLVGLAALCAALSGCKKAAPTPERDYMEENVERWRGELGRWGGSWAAWEREVQPFHEDVLAALAARPEGVDGLVGLDGFLFFRRSLEVLVGGDFREQKEGRDPYPAIVDFAQQLRAREIDLLFCPIPVKAAVFPEHVSRRAPPTDGPYVDLYTRKLMFELAEAGVECVDLLPQFLEARDELGADAAPPFYMKLDTHWSPRAVRLAARIIAERIKGYPWYPEVAKVRYSVKRAACKRPGDIVRMLPAAERAGYPPLKLEGEQVVNPDDTLYEDDKSSPVVLLGDSYAGIFHYGECEHAGLTAHVANDVGFPIDLILGQGMGPKVRTKLARRGKGALTGKKLVVWTLSERDLYNYRSPWAMIRMP